MMSSSPGTDLSNDSRDMVARLYAELIDSDPVEWAGLSRFCQRERILGFARRNSPLLNSHELIDLVERLSSQLTGYGPLDPLLAGEDITELMVNGDGSVWTEQFGRLERSHLVLDEQTVLQIIERIVAPLGRRIDRSSPVVDARLPDGSRINAVVSPIAVDGPCLTIRRFGPRPIDLDAFASPGVAALLSWAVASGMNIVVSGGTGSGKTTLLNALASAIPQGERVITIEDTAELRLGCDHVVRLEARDANAEGAGALSVRDLVRNALRMRPDRIVVGEVRGDEVIDMLQAMNTGHEGSMSTVHANSPLDALRRLESMVLMSAQALPLAVVRDQITSSVDLIVQVGRSVDGRRHIEAVHEMDERVGGDGSRGDCWNGDAHRDPGRGVPYRTRALSDSDSLTALPVRLPRRTGASRPLEVWVLS